MSKIVKEILIVLAQLIVYTGLLVNLIFEIYLSI